MARIRTIKPEFWQDEKLAPLSPIDRLVFLGLISQADDAGRLVDSVRMIDGLLFPDTEDSSRESLDTLATLSRLVRYRSKSGQLLIQIVGWEEHQKVDKPAKYVLPGPTAEDVAASKDRKAKKTSRETVAKSSRDPRSPIPDLRPTTNDQTALSAGADVARGFDEVWALHGRGAKKKAMAAYRKAVPKLTTHENLLEHLKAYVATFRADWHGAHLEKWIRDARWEENLSANGHGPGPPGKPMSDEQMGKFRELKGKYQAEGMAAERAAEKAYAEVKA